MKGLVLNNLKVSTCKENMDPDILNKILTGSQKEAEQTNDELYKRITDFLRFKGNDYLNGSPWCSVLMCFFLLVKLREHL